MATNPYAPPKTVVADPLEALAPRERPPQVRRLMQILWISFVVSVVSLLFSWRELAEIPFLPFMIGFIIFAYAIMLLINIKIAQGRNWARITYLVFALIGLPFFLIGMKEAVVSDRLSAAAGLIQTALQIAGVYFMFFSPAKLWFRKSG